MQHSLSEKATVVEEDNESEDELPDDDDLENNQNALPGINLETVLLGLRQHVDLFILNLQEKHYFLKQLRRPLLDILK